VQRLRTEVPLGPPVTVLASPGNGRAAIHGASHAPCKSGQAPRRAGTAIPGRLRSGSVAAFHTLGVLPRACAHPLSRVMQSCLSGSHRKAKKRLYCNCQRLPPIPLKGGFRRPSNIMRDYAQSIRHPSPQKARAAWRLACSLRRIISIMCKWPRRSRSIKRVANSATQQHLNLFPPTRLSTLGGSSRAKRRASSVPAKRSQPPQGKAKPVASFGVVVLACPSEFSPMLNESRPSPAGASQTTRSSLDTSARGAVEKGQSSSTRRRS